MLQNFIRNNDRKVLRFLEILPGLTSWGLILFPYWGIFVVPEIVAYFVLAFNVYWFYQSVLVAITATVSHIRVQASMKYDWKGDLENFPDWQKVRHLIIIPNYKEPLHILERLLESLSKQTLPSKMIVPCLAMEAAEPEEDRNEKINKLKKKYGSYFEHMIVTTHTLAAGEMRGKASNERYAAIDVYNNFVKTNKLDINYLTITSCDADHKYHPNHFANLTYCFLDSPDRYSKFCTYSEAD